MRSQPGAQQSAAEMRVQETEKAALIARPSIV